MNTIHGGGLKFLQRIIMATLSMSPPFNIIIRCQLFSPTHQLPPQNLIRTRSRSNTVVASHRFPPGRRSIVDEDDGDAVDCSGKFDEAVALFNTRDFHGCHDYLEEIWNVSQEPARTLVHGILQCAVGFHHLFNQNHKGAMMEIGEGLCKIRKMNFEHGPFHQFEEEMSTVLEFIYQTQLEFAALIL